MNFSSMRALIPVLALAPLSLAAEPRDPKQVSDTWEWCDHETGTHSITIWPEGDETRAQSVNFTSHGASWVQWLHPVQAINWICDGMSTPGKTVFSEPHIWWQATYTVEDKLYLWKTGRLHFAQFEARTTAKPRSLIVKGKHFVNRQTGETVLLKGANVVMKGPPWIPSTEGDSVCSDRWWSNYTCFTFTKKDAEHFQNMGWNFIRLGVVWAGGQPTEDPVLDAEWVRRLHALLAVADAHGIYVVLDVHQDAVGTATCGEGVPQWFSKKATPDHIGKPLLPIDKHVGPSWPNQADGLCMTNDTASWAEHAGEVDYNTKNKCCIRYNGGGVSWGRLINTWQAQETIHYQLRNHEGRRYYARYIGLLAEAVQDYPNAFGIETMNEPPSIERDAMFYTWRAAHDEVRAVIPDMAVSVQDTGESTLPIGDLGLWPDQIWWLHHAENLFYAFHWYSFPSDPKKGISDASWQSGYWNMPALMTEMNNCKVYGPAIAAGIGFSFWEYSNYCNTYPSKACTGNSSCDFGACITGIDGNSNFSCPDEMVDMMV